MIALPLNPVLFRLLRIGKLFRAIRMVHMTNMLPEGKQGGGSFCFFVVLWGLKQR